MDPSSKFLYVAYRSCGCPSAYCWDDPGYEKSTANCVAEYIKRGDKVERIEIQKDQKIPEHKVCKMCEK